MTEAMHLVLIVEDDPSLQSVLRMLFEANGYRVVAAGTVSGGAHDARLYNPDVVVVDLGFPDLRTREMVYGAGVLVKFCDTNRGAYKVSSLLS
jgi:DNA-binding response OmpR family regulator